MPDGGGMRTTRLRIDAIERRLEEAEQRIAALERQIKELKAEK